MALGWRVCIPLASDGEVASLALQPRASCSGAFRTGVQKHAPSWQQLPSAYQVYSNVPSNDSAVRAATSRLS